MRFQRIQRYEIPITDRKIAAAKRAIERKKTKAAKQYPLFPEYQEVNETVESRLQKYKEAHSAHERRQRNDIAKQWIKGRRILRSFPATLQQELLALWNAELHPSAENLHSLMWSELANKYRICYDCQVEKFGHSRSPREYIWCDGKLWEWWLGMNDWKYISPQEAKQRECEICGAKFFHYTVKRWKEKTFEQLDLLEAICLN